MTSLRKNAQTAMSHFSSCYKFSLWFKPKRKCYEEFYISSYHISDTYDL